MYKANCFRKFNIHFWLVILLLISSQNNYMYANNDNIIESEKSSINTRIRYEILVILTLVFIILGLSYKLYSKKKNYKKTVQSKEEQITNQNKIINKLFCEKEWLLEELHHRVKNNLQVVISLLNSQSAYLENKDALLAIQDSQHRMNAMSLIYQKLYDSEKLALIDMCWYIPELISYLKGVFNTEKKITYKLDIECVDLDVSQAVPLGLILNEAIINAIKYAYPSMAEGEVNIRLKRMEHETYQLIISDNGVGVADDVDLKDINSFGMHLMHGLSTQADGTFNIESKNGLEITINFTKQQLVNADKKD